MWFCVPGHRARSWRRSSSAARARAACARLERAAAVSRLGGVLVGGEEDRREAREAGRDAALVDAVLLRAQEVACVLVEDHGEAAAAAAAAEMAQAEATRVAEMAKAEAAQAANEAKAAAAEAKAALAEAKAAIEAKAAAAKAAEVAAAAAAAEVDVDASMAARRSSFFSPPDGRGSGGGSDDDLFYQREPGDTPRYNTAAGVLYTDIEHMFKEHPLPSGPQLIEDAAAMVEGREPKVVGVDGTAQMSPHFRRSSGFGTSEAGDFEILPEVLPEELLRVLDALVALKIGFVRHEHYIRGGHTVSFYAYRGRAHPNQFPLAAAVGADAPMPPTAAETEDYEKFTELGPPRRRAMSLLGGEDFETAAAEAAAADERFAPTSPGMSLMTSLSAPAAARLEARLRMECRGIGILRASRRVLCRPYHKFWHLGARDDQRDREVSELLTAPPQPPVPDVASGTLLLVEKVDGVMVQAFALDGRLFLATRSGRTRVAIQAEALLAHADGGRTAALCAHAVGAGYTPLLEFCSPALQPHRFDEPTLTLTALRHRGAGLYLPYATLRLLALKYRVRLASCLGGWKPPKEIRLLAEKDPRDAIERLAGALRQQLERHAPRKGFEGIVIKMPSGLTLKLKATTFIQGKQQRVAALEENYELPDAVQMILACAADAHARSEMVGPLSPDDDGVAYGASDPDDDADGDGGAGWSGSPGFDGAAPRHFSPTPTRPKRLLVGHWQSRASRGRLARAMRVLLGAAERRRLARLPPKLKSGGGAASLYFPTEVRLYPPRRPLPARPARTAAHRRLQAAAIRAAGAAPASPAAAGLGARRRPDAAAAAAPPRGGCGCGAVRRRRARRLRGAPRRRPPQHAALRRPEPPSPAARPVVCRRRRDVPVAAPRLRADGARAPAF